MDGTSTSHREEHKFIHNFIIRGEDRPIIKIYEGPFVKFVDSPYYSESELYGGTVTVSFSKYLPWQEMHFLQRSAHFSKTCCRQLITSKFLASELFFMAGKAQKSLGARSGLYGGCSNGVPPIHFFQDEHRIQFRSRPMRFLVFSSHEKGAPRQEISKCSTVCSTFSRRNMPIYVFCYLLPWNRKVIRFVHTKQITLCVKTYRLPSYEYSSLYVL
jgi:hypothetical protein